MAENEEDPNASTENNEGGEEDNDNGEANWTKMEQLVDRVVEKRLKEWRPAAQSSKKPPQQQAKTKKPGAFTEWFRKGLND